MLLGKNDKVYNRYAHLRINLGVKRDFSNKIAPDAAEITITYNDLKKWKVKYILVENNHDPFYNIDEANNIQFTKIYENSKDPHRIYHLNYQ